MKKENAEFSKYYLEQNRELNELLEALEGFQDYKDMDVNKNDSHKNKH
ncbi:hypothetical protein BGM24_13145 [Bacillus sp. FJAT-26377]|nr:hypothetical protein [Bacillus sp. FJAT-26377]